MDYQKNKEAIELLEKKIAEWSALSLNSAQKDVYDGMINEVKRLKELPAHAPLTVQGFGDGGRYAHTTDGQSIRMLSKTEKVLATIYSGQGEGWDLADFVRSGLGIRTAAEAVISSPATVPLLIGSMILDDVREKARIIQAGALTIPITAPTNICRIDGDPVVYDHGEGISDIAQSLPVLTPVVLNPGTLAALIPISMELAADSKNLDSALRTAISGSFALKLDQLGIVTILADGTIPTSGSGESCASWITTMGAVGSAIAVNQDIPLALISSAEDFTARAVELCSTGGQWLGPPAPLTAMKDLPTAGMTEGIALFGNFSQGVAVVMRQDLLVELVRFGRPETASHLLVCTMRARAIVLQGKSLYIQKTTVS